MRVTRRRPIKIILAIWPRVVFQPIQLIGRNLWGGTMLEYPFRGQSFWVGGVKRTDILRGKPGKLGLFTRYAKAESWKGKDRRPKGGHRCKVYLPRDGK